jgi:hypothetical protein
VEALAQGKTSYLTESFAKNSLELHPSGIESLKEFLGANDSFSFVSCIGYVRTTQVSAKTKATALARAKNVCSSVSSSDPTLVVESTRVKFLKKQSSNFSKVKVVLSDQSSLLVSSTFFYTGGGPDFGVSKIVSNTIQSVKEGDIRLPAAYRPGFLISGWFTSRTGGESVGLPGDTFNPRESQSLFARWIVPPPTSSSGPAQTSLSVTVNIVNPTELNCSDLQEMLVNPATTFDQLSLALEIFEEPSISLVDLNPRSEVPTSMLWSSTKERESDSFLEARPLSQYTVVSPPVFGAPLSSPNTCPVTAQFSNLNASSGSPFSVWVFYERSASQFDFSLPGFADTPWTDMSGVVPAPRTAQLDPGWIWYDPDSWLSATSHVYWFGRLNQGQNSLSLDIVVAP